LRTFLFQIVKALQYVHEKGFAHRDLKPENVLVCSDCCIKIADFGLAGPIPTNGMMRTICGSLHYMAPEILQEQPYDGPKADIWSLGIMVHAMAVNSLPWRSQDDASLVKEILGAPIAFPPEMSPDIVHIITICTKRNPRDRPTAAELLSIPWLADELPRYKRVFGMAGQLSVGQIREAEIKSTPSFPSVTRSSAKLIFSKPGLRAVPSNRTPVRGGKPSANPFYEAD
jgi:serine/threonine protein kinase